jgi:hypothetical protein
MNSKFLLSSIGAIVALLSACAPLIPYGQLNPPNSQNPAPGSAEAQAREIARQDAIRRAEANNPAPPIEKPMEPTPNGPVKPGYPRAIPIPGKEGYVFNPHTNNPVDVRGIPSGTLVEDPQDPNGSKHRFRVP